MVEASLAFLDDFENKIPSDNLFDGYLFFDPALRSSTPTPTALVEPRPSSTEQNTFVPMPESARLPITP